MTTDTTKLLLTYLAPMKLKAKGFNNSFFVYTTNLMIRKPQHRTYFF